MHYEIFLMNTNYYVVSGFQVAFTCLSHGCLYAVGPRLSGAIIQP